MSDVPEDNPFDDIEHPFEPYDPADVHSLIRQRFHDWWEALSPAGSFKGVALDKETAYATWMAAAEQMDDVIEALFSSSQATNELTNQKAYEDTCYAIFMLSGKKSFSFRLEDFFKWFYDHCGNPRREYHNGTITICCDDVENPPRPYFE